jgi:Bax protein
MLKLLKVILLVLVLIIVSVVVNEISSSDYIYPEYHIKLYDIEVINRKSILIQDKISLIPVKYIGTLDFDTIPEAIRKTIFINYMLPAIVIERDRLMDMLHHIEFVENGMINKQPLKSDDLLFFKEMMQKYDASSIKDLKMRLYPHPVSLILAQATLESGWGTSNVFSKANNPFGIMSFSSDEQRRKFMNPELQTEVYVRTYQNVNQSVEHYFFFTARLNSYEKFRKKRWERGSSSDLVKLLKSYHETNEYTTLIESIIKKNDFEKYDNISINKDYFGYKKNYLQLFRSYFEDYF